MQTEKLSSISANHFLSQYLQENHENSHSLASKVQGIFIKFLSDCFDVKVSTVRNPAAYPMWHYVEEDLTVGQIKELTDYLYAKAKELDNPKLAYYAFFIWFSIALKTRGVETTLLWRDCITKKKSGQYFVEIFMTKLNHIK